MNGKFHIRKERKQKHYISGTTTHHTSAQETYVGTKGATVNDHSFCGQKSISDATPLNIIIIQEVNCCNPVTQTHKSTKTLLQ